MVELIFGRSGMRDQREQDRPVLNEGDAHAGEAEERPDHADLAVGPGEQQPGDEKQCGSRR